MTRGKPGARWRSRRDGVNPPHFDIVGGLDVETPPISRPPGSLDGVSNFRMSIEGGIERIGGYERFDGQPSPTDSSDYYVLEFKNGSVEIEDGDVVDGATGSGTVLEVVLDSGTWGVDAAGELILGRVTTGFDVDEDLDVSSVKHAEVAVVEDLNGETDATLDAAYTQLAIADLRTQITAVPGASGKSVLGVWLYNDIVYAFREQDDGAVDMFKSSASGWATTAVTGLTTGGRYEFESHNFGTTKKMYAVSGVHKAFEWDGTTKTDITTGMSPDTPEHLAVKGNYLWASVGANIENSPPADPTGMWVLRSGSNIINTTDDVVGMQVQASALVVLDRNKTWLHTGTPAVTDDERFDLHSPGSGAIEWSLQSMGHLIYLDDYGLTDLQRTDAFGDFAQATISGKVKSLLASKRSQVVASVVNRSKNEYLLFFDDQSVLSMVFDQGRLIGFTELNLGIQVTCACSEEDSTGAERIFVGAEDGFVYEMEKGTSFDGSAIEASAQLAFHHYGSPRQKKRFYRFSPEIEADSNITVYIRPDFDYGDSNLAQPDSQDVLTGGGRWNVDNWDEFNWSTQTTSQPSIRVDGSGVNMGVMFYHSSATDEVFKITGATTELSPRRRRRR